MICFGCSSVLFTALLPLYLAMRPFPGEIKTHRHYSKAGDREAMLAAVQLALLLIHQHTKD